MRYAVRVQRGTDWVLLGFGRELWCIGEDAVNLTPEMAERLARRLQRAAKTAKRRRMLNKWSDRRRLSKTRNR